MYIHVYMSMNIQLNYLDLARPLIPPSLSLCSLCNTHDISWGTKEGTDGSSQVALLRCSVHYLAF